MKNSSKFREKLREATSKMQPDLSRPEADYRSLPTDRAHSEWVNFDHMARSGTQASLDFYHLSPVGLARYVQKQGSDGLQMIPRVRVLTTMRELLRLLDSAQHLAREIEPTLPEELRGQPPEPKATDND